MNQTNLLVCALLVLAGCQASPQVSKLQPGSLLGEQLKHQDEKLIGQRFRTLLDFEHDADAVFVRSDVSNVTSVGAHTGIQSLRVEGNSAVIGIDPLLYGKPLDADWTLLGTYLRLAGGGRVNTTLIADGKTITATQRDTTADIWLFAAVDLSDETIHHQLAASKKIQLRIDVPVGGFLMDDVLLVNNNRSLVSSTLDEVPEWNVEQAGLSIAINAQNRFSKKIESTLASPAGWSDEEVNAIRARFVSGDAKKMLTIYADGRAIENGKLSVLDGNPGAMKSAHEQPGEILVDESTGRLDRNTPGDANNDGYNEARGAYQLVAQGGRLTCRIVPNPRAPMVWPVIEVRGLSGQTFTATIEGRLFRSTCRADAETVLIMLPITLDRPAELVIKGSANVNAVSAELSK